MADALLELAKELWAKAYEQQMQGDLELAVQLYKRSIEMHPTAEAYTFLGWTYHFQGKIDEAIAECKKAIALDPSFGNPYNDIGAYLIEQGSRTTRSRGWRKRLPAPATTPTTIPGTIWAVFTWPRRCTTRPASVSKNPARSSRGTRRRSTVCGS